MSKIYIYGAGGHGKVVADIATACGYKEIEFIDDGNNSFKKLENIKDDISIPIALGIGNNNIRKKIFLKLKKQGFNIIKLIHPSSVISTNTILGEATVVMPNVVVNSSTKIGKGVILNTSSVVEHECNVKDFVHLSPSVTLSGDVEVGELTHIGINSCAIPGIKIGSNCIIGAGSTIVKNIRNYKKAYGTPCKEVKDLNK